VSVYISGLPKDITEEELGTKPLSHWNSQLIYIFFQIVFSLDILFSPQGKIKKIKIYADEKGQKKGDALITYSNPDSATTACFKVIDTTN
jgi:hypothetical protein